MIHRTLEKLRAYKEDSLPDDLVRRIQQDKARAQLNGKLKTSPSGSQAREGVMNSNDPRGALELIIKMCEQEKLCFC